MADFVLRCPKCENILIPDEVVVTLKGRSFYVALDDIQELKQADSVKNRSGISAYCYCSGCQEYKTLSTL